MQYPDWPIHEYVLPFGMRLVALPRPNWLRTVVTLGIPFGAADTQLQRDSESLSIPTGAAHLLEHCVMNTVQRQWQTIPQADGIPLQAQTGLYHTSYSFWTTESALPLLQELLNALLGIHGIDGADLEHEQRIVVREINTTTQAPTYLHRQHTLQALFQTHPVRNGILGQANAITTFTAHELTELYRWMYQPSAMTLFIAGPIEPEAILASLTNLSYHSVPIPRSIHNDEPQTVTTHQSQIEAPAAQPSLRIAFKETHLDQSYAQREISSLLAMDLLNQTLRQSGIPASHHHDYAGHRNFGYSVMAWTTSNPATMIEQVFTALERLKATPPTSAELEVAIQQRALRVLQTMEQPEQAVNWLQSLDFKGLALNDYCEKLWTCSRNEIHERLEAHFQPSASVTCILTPRA